MRLVKIHSKRKLLAEEIVPYIYSHDKKPVTRQIRELRLLKNYYNCRPTQYIYYRMYLRSFDEDIYDYIPLDIVEKYRDYINPKCAIANVKNKIIFNKIMSANNFPTLPNLFIISKQRRIIDSEDKVITFKQFLDILYNSGNTEFFIKPSHGIGGEEAHRMMLHNGSLTIDSEKIVSEDHMYGKLFTQQKYKEFIAQNLFYQHDLLSKMNNSSVNTVRIDTFVDGGGISFNAASLRIGSGDTCVDNFARGGISLKVNVESGLLDPNGIIMSKHGWHHVQQHPISHFRFQGIVIPFWDEVKKLARSAAMVLLPLRWLGWDIAIGKDGPILFEANHDLEVRYLQQYAGGLRRRPIGRDILRTFPPRH